MICLGEMVTRDNRTAAAALDALKVLKVCRRVHPPNISQDLCKFEDLVLLVNHPADWILGCQHRRIFETFFNVFAACDGPPVDNAYLVELFSFVLRLMTVASFSEFEEANKNTGVQMVFIIGVKFTPLTSFRLQKNSFRVPTTFLGCPAA